MVDIRTLGYIGNDIPENKHDKEKYLMEHSHVIGSWLHLRMEYEYDGCYLPDASRYAYEKSKPENITISDVDLLYSEAEYEYVCMLLNKYIK